MKPSVVVLTLLFTLLLSAAVAPGQELVLDVDQTGIRSADLDVTFLDSGGPAMLFEGEDPL